ncbi:hypothetical protein IQ268_15430 [Oculatella sp. LEGE 06141]|uniref:hypothetical protein n=1 Tax=Oculatella sp. LEGE 06141 TaxID=1828648 RepID=UPI00188011E0|nr:hypothetical protein [Oculatella sp. LEGE 06141]MBE9179963.1 hypothetical protein [Oculatella sp. LEGE 06141]
MTSTGMNHWTDTAARNTKLAGHWQPMAEPTQVNQHHTNRLWLRINLCWRSISHGQTQYRWNWRASYQTGKATPVRLTQRPRSLLTCWKRSRRLQNKAMKSNFNG